MLFGVRVKVDPMRKSVSMNNLSQYEQSQDSSNNVDISAAAFAGATGYASVDDAAHHQSNASRERKRGLIPISFILLVLLVNINVSVVS